MRRNVARAWLLLSMVVLPPCQAQTPAETAPVKEQAAQVNAIRSVAASTSLDTPAQSFIRKLPADALKEPPKRRFNSGDYVNPRVAIVLDEIRVYGQIEPEDFTRKKSPLAQFRERLEKDRPMTPAEKVKLALCFIGLCGGVPVELSPEDRAEARLSQTTTQLNAQFRGTLQ